MSSRGCWTLCEEDDTLPCIDRGGGQAVSDTLAIVAFLGIKSFTQNYEFCVSCLLEIYLTFTKDLTTITQIADFLIGKSFVRHDAPNAEVVPCLNLPSVRVQGWRIYYGTSFSNIKINLKHKNHSQTFHNKGSV